VRPADSRSRVRNRESPDSCQWRQIDVSRDRQAHLLAIRNNVSGDSIGYAESYREIWSLCKIYNRVTHLERYWRNFTRPELTLLVACDLVLTDVRKFYATHEPGR
jgi:hypothetical protein